jgi:predicted transcriptional regulator
MGEKKAQTIKKRGAVDETSIRVSSPLQQRAKIYAAKARTTLLAVMNEALEEYLKKHSA